MKKILLIIVLAFCIFQMAVLAIEIDIGSEAIDRTSNLGDANRCAVAKNNPANATGVITSIEIYAYAAMTGVEVATFYVVSGDNLSTRDTETIGEVPEGYSEHTVSLNVNIGDCIGIYYSTGNLELTTTGGLGIWYYYGDMIPCSDETFTPIANYIISLCGTGATVGWPHKWDTKEISKWNTKEFTKWNGLE